MSIIIFIIILLVLVLVHEFGHFFSAKKFGIRVDEFGFGFPPKLFGVKKGETEYTFNLLPIGGFVKIFGENPDDENTHGPDKDRSFVNKPKYQQAIVLFAGVFANFLLAWVLFSVGFIWGFPTSVGTEPEGHTITDSSLIVISVLPDSPADLAGMRMGDKIVKIESANDVEDNVNPTTLSLFVGSHGGEEITFNFIRGEETGAINIIPTQNEADSRATIGISMDQIGTLKLPFLKAIWQGLVLATNATKNVTMGIFELFKGLFVGNASLDSVAGPVGMVGIVGNAYNFGFVYLLSFVGIISINLTVINLLPFPALDGGRLLFLLIEQIKGSRLNPKVANITNLIGFAILILLMLVVTYHDIIKL